MPKEIRLTEALHFAELKVADARSRFNAPHEWLLSEESFPLPLHEVEVIEEELSLPARGHSYEEGPETDGHCRHGGNAVSSGCAPIVIASEEMQECQP